VTKIPSILEPIKPRRRKKKKRRKVDYTELLQPAIIPDVQCPHTKKTQDASLCSQCLSVKPSIIHRPPTASWWAEDIDLPDIEVDDIVLPEDE
jgi:hypothetical protein